MHSTRDIFKDRVPIRANYDNLIRRADSEREFLESINIANVHHDGSVRMYGHPSVVASFMSRQLFLRSYPFTREEDYEKKIGCFRCCKKKEVDGVRKVHRARLRKAKKMACSALKSIFRRAFVTVLQVASQISEETSLS